jgi:two-component system, NarL family, invasion response regulator UvrY
MIESSTRSVCSRSPRLGAAMTSVLVIDDHSIVLKGCRRVLEDAGVQIVLEARDLVCGYRLYCHPGGVLLIRQIRLRDSGTQIVVFSIHDNRAIVRSTLEAAASGYLLKDCASEELARAVEQVRAGKPYPVTRSPYRSLCGTAIHNLMC